MINFKYFYYIIFLMAILSSTNLLSDMEEGNVKYGSKNKSTLESKATVTTKASKVNVMLNEDKIEVEAMLEKFILQGVYDEYMDGTSISYDISVFVVNKPNKYQGKKFQVQHNQTPKKESPWRCIGQSYLLKLDKEFITSNNTIAGTNAVIIVKKLGVLEK